MANSWLLNRLREINEQSKSWPAWVFEQPLTRRDAEKIARGERLRSPATMASENVPTTKCDGCGRPVAPIHYYHHLAGCVVDLAVEVRELRRDKIMAFRLMRSRGDRLSAIRDCIRQNKGDDLVRVEVEYLLDCPHSELDAAMGVTENG